MFTLILYYLDCKFNKKSDGLYIFTGALDVFLVITIDGIFK